MHHTAIAAAVCLGISLIGFHTDAFGEDNNKTSSTMKCKDGKTVTVSVTGNYGGCSKTWINGQQSAQCTSQDQKASGGCNQYGNSYCDPKNTGACTVSRTATAQDFTCHTEGRGTPWCECKGAKTSVDCRGMAKNCKSGTWNCDGGICTCVFARSAAAPPKGQAGAAPPPEGILGGGPTFPSQGPAPTGGGKRGGSGTLY